MKKSYLMIAAAATLFAACAEKDTFKDVDTQDAVIGFGYTASENTTRALNNQELTMDWFHELDNAFGVYGYKGSNNIFKNERVYLASKTETTGDNVTSVYKWAHATVRFWDKAATSAYKFYAYAPFEGTTNTEGTNPTFSTTTGFTFTGIKLIENIKTAGSDKAVATAVENIGWGDSRLDNSHSNSPTVQFVFNHILSKLSFKIKTDIETTVASFTVTSIKIDFPSDDAVQWAQSQPNNTTGQITYSNGYAAKTGSKAAAAFETEVFTGEQAVPYSVATSGATALGETFIVTPVNSTKTKHEFDVQVTYNITYADNTTETGCIATGTIGSDTPGATGATNVYAPAQNQYYVAIINLKPAGIEFCVENVNAWVESNLNPVDVD